MIYIKSKQHNIPIQRLKYYMQCVLMYYFSIKKNILTHQILAQLE